MHHLPLALGGAIGERDCQPGLFTPGGKPCLRSGCFDPSRLWRRLGVLALGTATQADVFNMGGTRDGDRLVDGLASLASCPCRLRDGYGNTDDDTGCGAVGYTYNIGKYEVTAGQYTEFLNAVARTRTPTGCTTRACGRTPTAARSSGRGTFGQPTRYSVAADWANRPVNYVILGRCGAVRQLAAQRPADGTQGPRPPRTGRTTSTARRAMQPYWPVNRKADWKWAIPSEDEWYKAAYHRNDGDTGNYCDYPTSNNSDAEQRSAQPRPGEQRELLPGRRRLHDRQSVLQRPRSASSRTRRVPTARSTRAATSGSGTRRRSPPVRRVGCVAAVGATTPTSWPPPTAPATIRRSRATT